VFKIYLNVSDKKDKKKDEAPPPPTKGVYIFPNGDKYGKYHAYPAMERVQIHVDDLETVLESIQ
jgi:hypothetical protein